MYFELNRCYFSKLCFLSSPPQKKKHTRIHRLSGHPMTAGLKALNSTIVLYYINYHSGYHGNNCQNVVDCGLIMFVCLCFTPHRQRGHLGTAPPFTVPCEGREAR